MKPVQLLPIKGLPQFESSVLSNLQQFEQYPQSNDWKERLSVGCHRAQQSVGLEEEGGVGSKGSESGEAEDQETRRALV